MRRWTVATSTLLAVSGMATAIGGIVGGEVEAFGAGCVLLFGAAIFARLSRAPLEADKRDPFGRD